MAIFNSYVKLPEGIYFRQITCRSFRSWGRELRAALRAGSLLMNSPGKWLHAFIFTPKKNNTAAEKKKNEVLDGFRSYKTTGPEPVHWQFDPSLLPYWTHMVGSASIFSPNISSEIRWFHTPMNISRLLLILERSYSSDNLQCPHHIPIFIPAKHWSA